MSRYRPFNSHTDSVRSIKRTNQTRIKSDPGVLTTARATENKSVRIQSRWSVYNATVIRNCFYSIFFFFFFQELAMRRVCCRVGRTSTTLSFWRGPSSISWCPSARVSRNTSRRVARTEILTSALR